MTNIATHAHTPAPLFGFVRTLFTSIGDGIQAIIWANTAARQVDALMALSDAELANRGLKRGDIAKYVFSDSCWV